jgi:hypothetical protein
MSVAEGHGVAINQRRWADWEARLARWRTSGTSIRPFCLDEGVCEPSFYQWRKRLLRAGSAASGHARSNGEATTGTAPTVPKPGTARFLPVELVGGNLPEDPQVEILLTSGVVVRVPCGVDEARLRWVLRLLRDEASSC